ncbi:MAG: hypothetical protein ACO1OB_02855 [Archangium sp.]
MKTSLSRRIAVAALAVVSMLGACAPADRSTFLVSADTSAIDGDTQRAVFRIQAVDVDGNPGTGAVKLTAPVGRFLDEAVLVDGFATAAYRCAPSEDTACNGPVRIGAEWNGNFASAVITVRTAPVSSTVKWEVRGTNTTSNLLAVATSPTGIAWAVGEHGAVVRLVNDAWETVSAPVTTTLRAITFDHEGQPVVVGYGGTLLQFRDGSFVAVPTAITEDFTAVAVDAAGTVHVGTRGGALLRLEAGALVLHRTAPGSIESMASNGAELWAVGDTFAARWVPDAWELMASPLDAQFSSATTVDGAVLLSGSIAGEERRFGVLVTGPSPQWTSSALPEPVTAATRSGDERFALGSSGRMYRQEGNGSWLGVELPAVPRAMTSRGPGDLVVLSRPGVSLVRSR